MINKVFWSWISRMSKICQNLLLLLGLSTTQFKSELLLLSQLCQPADVPLFGSRGVRLLQLKLGHLLHLLNLTPLRAATPPPSKHLDWGFTPPPHPFTPCRPHSSPYTTYTPHVKFSLSAPSTRPSVITYTNTHNQKSIYWCVLLYYLVCQTISGKNL